MSRVQLLQLRRALDGVRDEALRFRAEITVSIAALAGWASLTIGAHALVATFSIRAAAAVWPTSIGALLVSACGWSFLGQIARRGLYVLTRSKKGQG